MHDYLHAIAAIATDDQQNVCSVVYDGQYKQHRLQSCNRRRSYRLVLQFAKYDLRLIIRKTNLNLTL